jgi:fluoroquinolone transport system permease protein
MNENRMRRMKNAVIADLKFERKQGFFTIYLIISFLYLLVLTQIPETYRHIAVPFVIFSDPSVLGLFFIGGMLLLEKEQGILQSIVVTPLESMEYVISKVMSLSIVALFAGVLISLLAYSGSVNYLYLVMGILLTSFFFTQIGILIACRSRGINEFFLRMVPWMLALIAPAFFLIPYWEAAVLNLFPTVACLRLVYGAYHGNPIGMAVFQMGYMILINGGLLIYTTRQFEERIVYGGQHGQIDLSKE